MGNNENENFQMFSIKNSNAGKLLSIGLAYKNNRNLKYNLSACVNSKNAKLIIDCHPENMKASEDLKLQIDKIKNEALKLGSSYYYIDEKFYLNLVQFNDFLRF